MTDPKRFLPLTVPVFQILVSLADQDLHGYAIIQDIDDRTDGDVMLTASTLYAAVKRMLDWGLIEELTKRPNVESNDSRRRYYRITRSGREVAGLEGARLERFARMARDKNLLNA